MYEYTFAIRDRLGRWARDARLIRSQQRARSLLRQELFKIGHEDVTGVVLRRLVPEENLGQPQPWTEVDHFGINLRVRQFPIRFDAFAEENGTYQLRKVS